MTWLTAHEAGTTLAAVASNQGNVGSEHRFLLQERIRISQSIAVQ